MMGRNQIGSELVTSNSQQISTDQSTLLRKCLKKKKILWIIIGIIIVILIITITIVIIKTKTKITKLSIVTSETTNEDFTTTAGNPTTEKFTTKADNPTTEVQSKPKCDKWKQHGITVAGVAGQTGDWLNQFSNPQGIYIDDDESILIADAGNHRVVKWKDNPNSGQVVAGGMEIGHRPDQLHMPLDVTVDKKKNVIIVCDYGNWRVTRWFFQSQANPQIYIDNIACGGVTMDKSGSLYVSDWQKDEVTRWKEGDTYGTIVAGGNRKGENFNQLWSPSYIFVDKDYSVYVSDTLNHRIIKWKKDAQEGIVVAGGNGVGNHLNQLFHPFGMIVDNLGQIIIADYENHRIMKWYEGDANGSVVAGGNGEGERSDQLLFPRDVSFDIEGNLYVTDSYNHRIQKYEQCTE
ncbi:unnamed protein product [Adineta steineri]|uniref:Uncharacterized protein n=1 Tax=Adineta steineri TaxID=433720 RepID=A0A819PP85_9BILA|nr:unnamed protein product [Adineta steineri]CAF4012430.1 unnamed protein product [Adineta steineri]